MAVEKCGLGSYMTSWGPIGNREDSCSGHGRRLRPLTWKERESFRRALPPLPQWSIGGESAPLGAEIGGALGSDLLVCRHEAVRDTRKAQQKKGGSSYLCIDITIANLI